MSRSQRKMDLEMPVSVQQQACFGKSDPRRLLTTNSEYLELHLIDQEGVQEDDKAYNEVLASGHSGGHVVQQHSHSQSHHHHHDHHASFVYHVSQSHLDSGSDCMEKSSITDPISQSPYTGSSELTASLPVTQAQGQADQVTHSLSHAPSTSSLRNATTIPKLLKMVTAPVSLTDGKSSAKNDCTVRRNPLMIEENLPSLSTNISAHAQPSASEILARSRAISNIDLIAPPSQSSIYETQASHSASTVTSTNPTRIAAGTDYIQSTPTSEQSLPDASAFLSMPSGSIDQDLSEAVSYRVLENGTSDLSNGVLQLIDVGGNNRLICIQGEGDGLTGLTNNTLQQYSLGNLIVNADGVITNAPEQLFDMRQIGPLPEKTDPQPSEKPKPKSGWPKGRKRVLDPGKRCVVKPPSSGYLLFAKERRKEIQKEWPMYTFAEVTRMIGTEWSEMDVDRKTKYLNLAQADMERFKEEVQGFKTSEEYQTMMKRKKEIAEKNCLSEPENELLYCRICDQYFSNQHNKSEHLLSSKHLKQISKELNEQRKEKQPPPVTEAESSVSAGTSWSFSEGLDVSLDINRFMEELMGKHSEREIELQMLRKNAQQLQDLHAGLQKDLTTLKESETKLHQDIQNMKQWSAQLTRSIDNLKMVPTLFGVINF